jgi:hypothetical protein
MKGEDCMTYHKHSNPALENLKNEVAQEIGVELKDYNPDITAREAGKIGGNIVRKVFEQYKNENR